MSSDDATAGLYLKLAEVVAEVEEVSKRGHNEHFNYAYATAEDVLKVIRVPLAKRKVMLLSSLSAIEERPYKTSRGNESVITTVHVEYTFVDGETGARHECSWAGEGDDPADKGLGKAYTNAAKTFLRQQFLLPQGDDPEADPNTDKRAADRTSSGRRGSRGGSGLASDAQKKFLRSLITQNRLDEKTMRRLFAGAGFDVPESEKVNDAINRLPKATCTRLIDFIKDGAIPTGESDVPSGGSEFTHSAEKPDEFFDEKDPVTGQDVQVGPGGIE